MRILMMFDAAVYKGTVNDPTDFPPPSRTHGSYHWAFERILCAGLIPLTGAAFAGSTTAFPVLDGLLAISLVMHSHIGVSLLSYVICYHLSTECLHSFSSRHC